MTDPMEQARNMLAAGFLDALEALRRLAVDPKESVSRRQGAQRLLARYEARPQSVKLYQIEKALRAKVALTKK